MPYSPAIDTRAIGNYTRSRDNNFNLLRFLAACGVILSHSILLSGQLNHGAAWALGYLSVNCFFIISGFLVSASLLNRSSIRRYTLARTLRIYPALFLCVSLSILIVGILTAQRGLPEFLLSTQTVEFWFKNSLLFVGQVQMTLPTELFAENPVKSQVNAPLWTLQYEILMYFVLALIFFISRLAIPARSTTYFLMAVTGIGVVCMFFFLLNITQEQPLRGALANLVRFGAMFFYGSTLYLLRDKIHLKLGTVLSICFVIVLSVARRELFVCAVYLSLGYILIYLAYIPSGPIRLFNKLGDYSYGLYIYAFPIQQLLMHYYPATGAAELLVMSFSITLIVAVASWHFIERSALALKR